MSPMRKPAATWRIGGGTGRRRAIAVTATTTAANAIARTIGGSSLTIVGGRYERVGSRDKNVLLASDSKNAR